jgi:hypothetical protein
MSRFEKREETLCWHCSKSCTSGCNWSARFQPVDGWEAEPTMVGEVGSVLVRYCPEFAYEDRAARRWDLHNVGCVNLVERVLEIARDDYIKGPDQMGAQVERFIRGRGASKLHQIANPDEVIEMLRADRLEYRKKKAREAMIKGGGF